MLKAFFLICLLVVFATSQYFPCANYTLTPITAHALTNTTNITLAEGFNKIVGRWNNPKANTSYVINLYGWSSYNGSLVEAYFNPVSNGQISAGIAYNQNGVLFSPISGNITGGPAIFAQKDTSNANFQIKLTSLISLTNSSTGFYLQLYYGSGYNNLINKTCTKTCNSTIAFATLNGTIVPTQFVCNTNQQEGFFESLVNGFLSIFQ